MLEFHKKLISLRRKHPVLADGGFKPLKPGDDKELLAYARYNANETIVAVFNNSSRKMTVEINTAGILSGKKDFYELLSDRSYNCSQQGIIKLELAPKSVVLLADN